MGHDHSSLGIESQGHRSRCQRSRQKCVRYTSIYCYIPWVLINGRSSGFPLWSHQMRGSAERRVAWRGQSQQQRRSSARVGVVARSVWPRSWIDGSFFVYIEYWRRCCLLNAAAADCELWHERSLLVEFTNHSDVVTVSDITHRRHPPRRQSLCFIRECFSVGNSCLQLDHICSPRNWLKSCPWARVMDIHPYRHSCCTHRVRGSLFRTSREAWTRPHCLDATENIAAFAALCKRNVRQSTRKPKANALFYGFMLTLKLHKLRNKLCVIHICAT